MFNFLFKKDKITSLNMEEIIDNSHNSTCMFYNINENKSYRDYIDDFIDYYEVKNSNSYFDITLDNNEITLKTSTFYNEKTNTYYYEVNNNISLKSIIGKIGIIVKHNNKIIDSIRFQYKVNNPKSNSDIIKILYKKSLLYLFLKRDTKKNIFYFYKIIFTQVS